MKQQSGVLISKQPDVIFAGSRLLSVEISKQFRIKEKCGNDGKEIRVFQSGRREKVDEMR